MQVNCSLAGFGQIVSLDCNLAGNGSVGTTTTTTSTSTSTTSTTSSTTTTTTTPAPTTTTTTTTAAPCECFSYDVIIGQEDLDDATGNTDPGKDNEIVYVEYTNCAGSLTIVQYSLAGTFPDSICVDTNATSPTIYYYKNNIQTAPSTSSVSLTTNDCCVS